MEHSERQDGSRKSNLDGLPDSSDREFWGDVDIHTNLIPHGELSESGHNFVRVAGHQAQCTKCYWGFELDPGDRIENGKLFDKKGKLII